MCRDFTFSDGNGRAFILKGQSFCEHAKHIERNFYHTLQSYVWVSMYLHFSQWSQAGSDKEWTLKKRSSKLLSLLRLLSQSFRLKYTLCLCNVQCLYSVLLGGVAIQRQSVLWEHKSFNLVLGAARPWPHETVSPGCFRFRISNEHIN